MLDDPSDVGAEVAVGNKEMEGEGVEPTGEDVGEVEGATGAAVIYALSAVAGASVIFE